MRIGRQILILALISAVPLAAVATGAPKVGGKGPVTVADFAVMVANAGSGRTVEAGKAVETLRRAGVPLGDPAQVLSQGRLAEIMRHFGVNATTSSPEAVVTLARAESAVALISSSFKGAAISGESSTSVAPSSDPLDDCLLEANHGQCVNCCKQFPGTTAKTCARFCFQINKGSTPEPIP
jgi:hypothetical protein